MTVTKLKLAVVGTFAVAAIAAPVVVQNQSTSRLRDENRILQEQQSHFAQLASENERLSNLVAQASSAPALEQDQVRELLRLRGEVASLRQQSKQLAQLQKENGELRTRQAAITAYRQEPLPSDDATRNYCINQLRQIDGAIQQYALEHKLSENDSVTAEQIIPYLKNYTDAVFRCPSGGTYTFGPVTNVPLCSVPGHAIPTDLVNGKP
jgi:cell division protein FtsB